jgi:hypothetical protein
MDQITHWAVWEMTRFTVCHQCSRYTRTDKDALCLKCARKNFEEVTA